MKRKINFVGNGSSENISSQEKILLELPLSLYCFYTESEPGEDGFPQNGALWEDGVFKGNSGSSFFDVSASSDAEALLVIPEKKANSWTLERRDDTLTLTLSPGQWTLKQYAGNEPDWTYHPFPFRELPCTTEKIRHACVRGLLDFLAGTRRSPANGAYFQSPNTSIGKGYSGDGIPDTFFQFVSAYPFLSEKRKAFFRSQLDFLGRNMRFDSCIPWGGCRQDVPYYHLWKRTDCGMFFDANGLWLEMNRLLYRFDHILPDPERIIRAADFYLHYMTEEGLVAAESKLRGCEWADFLKNGHHSSLINVIAYRGLDAAAELLDLCQIPELAQRYRVHAARLKKSLNKPVKEGGLFKENGLVDWRDVDGTLHDYWRIDTHALAYLWDVLTEENGKKVMDYFVKEYFKNPPAVPAPYLLKGSWYGPDHDDTLEETRSYGGGRASMPGRMGGPLVAALYKYGNTAAAEYIFNQLCDLVCHEKALWEYYEPDGKGCFARSYIEHSLSVLYALQLKTIHSI